MPELFYLYGLGETTNSLNLINLLNMIYFIRLLSLTV